VCSSLDVIRYTLSNTCRIAPFRRPLAAFFTWLLEYRLATAVAASFRITRQDSHAPLSISIAVSRVVPHRIHLLYMISAFVVSLNSSSHNHDGLSTYPGMRSWRTLSAMDDDRQDRRDDGKLNRIEEITVNLPDELPPIEEPVFDRNDRYYEGRPPKDWLEEPSSKASLPRTSCFREE
jgi:hypothetical protein